LPFVRTIFRILKFSGKKNKKAIRIMDGPPPAPGTREGARYLIMGWINARTKLALGPAEVSVLKAAIDDDLAINALSTVLGYYPVTARDFIDVCRVVHMQRVQNNPTIIINAVSSMTSTMLSCAARTNMLSTYHLLWASQRTSEVVEDTVCAFNMMKERGNIFTSADANKAE
jgi:hypothetical protein